MDISVHITFNGFVATYDEQDAIIEILSGKLPILHTIFDLMKDREKCKIVLEPVYEKPVVLNKCEFYFQHKEGNTLTNILVKTSQIKQLLKYITIDNTIDKLLSHD